MILQAPHIRPAQENGASPAGFAKGNLRRHIASDLDCFGPFIGTIIAASNEVLTNEYRLAMKRILDRNQNSAWSPDCCRKLTIRQQQTLILLLCGCSEKEIAAEFGVRPTTVHAHIKAIFTCFAVHGRAELMALFLRPLVELLLGHDLTNQQLHESNVPGFAPWPHLLERSG